MQDLCIDIETFSSADIKKCGAYKYAQAADFEVLLFAYSLDGGEVSVVDLARGEEIPAPIIALCFDENCRKHAYNAAFEWYCLSRYFKLSSTEREEWAAQWRCTMLEGLYCGYPGGLAAVGEALNLGGDKQKMTEGRALIREFCVPCKATARNGNKTRIMPRDDPEGWELFKEYNARDVAAEMAVGAAFAAFAVPARVQEEWRLDLISNSRGVAVDLELVHGAQELSEKSRAALVEQAGKICGLDNPNSTAQLLRWLKAETGRDIADLTKQTVAGLLEGELGLKARRMLEIRQELNKTSVTKYDAMNAACGDDGRVRGLLQFYGANRTGRWAGRLVQVQNLPQTHISCLPQARELVKRRDGEILSLVYGGVPDTLSQLVRTAFVAGAGKVFIDADFSAIEARVIAWLAGEQWVLEVFRGHGKIYEATAAQMFGVPIEKIARGNAEYALRQKGKVATLALGYQGGAGALVQMGALRMGLSEAELPDIVSKWRTANPSIVGLWSAVQKAAINCVNTGAKTRAKGLVFEHEYSGVLHFLTVLLPSGRKLYYARPFISPDKWGRDALYYYGTNQKTGKWEPIDTYGGKLTENIVQAIARDCLAEKLTRLHHAGYDIVFHVHDEIVIEVEREKADLDAVLAIMAEPVSWAPDLPNAAEGWIDEFYKKD